MKPERPDSGAVQVHLARVLARPPFVHSPRQSAFLRYLVEKGLSGQDADLKESLIGVHVFGKRPDYDPKSDSTVRSEAAKLRTKLEQYYREDGKGDPVVILIAKGSYIPEFTVRPGYRRKLISIAFALAILASVIGLAIALSLRRAPRAPAFYSAVPLTRYAGSEISPSFAPDGDRIAFAWDGEKQDNFDIYVKQIGVAGPLRLTSDSRSDLSPAWSPDGREIAFLRLSSAEKAEVLLMPSLTGEPVRRLTEVSTPDPAYTGLSLLAWSPNSKWLVVSDGGASQSPRALYLVSVETGERRRLTVPAPEYDDFEPAFSPDMSRLVFARHSGLRASDLHLLSLSKDLYPQGESKRLTFYNRRTSSPVWMPDGRTLLFTRHESAGTHSLWRMVLSNPPRIEPLPISAESSSALAVSAQRNRLVYSRQISDTNIWGVELPGSWTGGRLNETPKSWLASSGLESTPHFSPDGRHIAFQSTRSGSDEVWVADRDGSHPRQLTEIGAAVSGFPRWSPDGNKIVFHSRPKGYASLFVIDARGGRPEPLTHEPCEDYSPSWSRDGRRIYFGSQRTEGSQIWMVLAKGGPATQITRHGGWAPLESTDGQYLFYAKHNHGLWRLLLSGGKEHQVLADVAGIGSAYDIGKTGIYFIGRANHAPGQTLAVLSFATGQITSLATISRPVDAGLAVSPDERLILYSQVDQIGGDLMLVENFR